MQTLASELVELIADDIAPGGEVVDTASDLLLTGLVDSLGVIRIVQWLEDRLGTRIDPVDVTLDNFRSVDAMVRYVDVRGGAPA